MHAIMQAQGYPQDPHPDYIPQQHAPPFQEPPSPMMYPPPNPILN